MAARKARKEGEAVAPGIVTGEEAEALLAPFEDAPPRKHADPVAGDDGDALDRISKSFRERFPEEWENIRLCPLQHGIPAMSDLLRSR